MDPLEKLRQEEAELEAQMLGNQTDPEDAQPPQEPEVSATADTDYERTEEEAAADEYMMDTITGEHDEPEPQPDQPEEPYEPEPQPQKPKRTNWKKRFTNYKASTDATINGLRRDLIGLKDQNTMLLRELQSARVDAAQREVQGDLFEGAFTQDDEDTFGAEGLEVVKKAAKVAIERQVKPLEKELQQHKEARLNDMARATQNEKRAEYQGFLSRLETLVPEYAELNADSKFLKWLGQADEYSGYVRKDLLRKAEASRDVVRVADFFMDYLRTQSPNQGLPKDLERHVTPVGTGGGGGTPRQQRKPADKGYYRKSDIDKFYSDVMKGRYKDDPGVIAVTEKAIEDASREGRILPHE